MSSAVDTTLATQINEALAESNRLAESAVMEAARAGKLMIEAKKQVPHGQWSQWIQENCHMTDRNARRYMQLARELPKLGDHRRAEVMSLPIREAVQAIAQSKPTPVVSAAQNGHAVSVLPEKTGPEGKKPDTTTDANTIHVRTAGLGQRLRQVFNLIADPTRALGKSLWHILTKRKAAEHQPLMSSPKR